MVPEPAPRPICLLNEELFEFGKRCDRTALREHAVSSQFAFEKEDFAFPVASNAELTATVGTATVVDVESVRIEVDTVDAILILVIAGPIRVGQEIRPRPGPNLRRDS